MQNVLITGGTGLIGTHLTKLLGGHNYSVNVLTRSPKSNAAFKEFKWDPANEFIEDEAILKADYIIHLAGAGIADKRWTSKRKKELYDSRVTTANLLYKKCLQLNHLPKAFVSSSGISIYGMNTGSALQVEDQPKLGSDFLAELCKDWEAAANQFNKNGVRVVCLRTSVVLAKEAGALPKMTLPAKLGLASPLGTGDQYISWIHIDDICRMYLFAIQNNISGAYNAVSANPVTNREFMQSLSKTFSRPFFLPNVPSFGLNLVFGELAGAVLGGNRVSNEKILREGFEFSFTTINSAFQNLLK